MYTTIKISEENRKRLFQVKNRLEENLDKALTYNETIGILIDKLAHVNRKDLVRGMASLKGILNESDFEFYKEMRAVDKRREDRYIGN